MTKKNEYSAAICTFCGIGIVFCILFACITGGVEHEPEAQEFTVTAYCPCEACCGRFSDGITASGHIIQHGDKFCAASPEIPYGTMLDIPGYGVVPVLDCGGTIKGDRLDVFFTTHQEALEWGIQKLKVRQK